MACFVAASPCLVLTGRTGHKYASRLAKSGRRSFHAYLLCTHMLCAPGATRHGANVQHLYPPFRVYLMLCNFIQLPEFITSAVHGPITVCTQLFLQHITRMSTTFNATIVKCSTFFFFFAATILQCYETRPNEPHTSFHFVRSITYCCIALGKKTPAPTFLSP